MKPATDTKHVLTSTVLPEFLRRGPYASVPAIRRALTEAGSRVQPATVNRYLSVLLKEGAIFDAGRGWYSFLKDRAQLDPEPVAALIAEVRAAFPLARFAAWSTAQVNPWMHHLIGTPTAVLDVEKDAIESVADRLEGSGWKVFLNPTGAAARRFAPGPKAVVLRVLHSAAPEAPGGLATPEQVLVELRVEAAELGLMTVAESPMSTSPCWRPAARRWPATCSAASSAETLRRSPQPRLPSWPHD